MTRELQESIQKQGQERSRNQEFETYEPVAFDVVTVKIILEVNIKLNKLIRTFYCKKKRPLRK